MVAVFVATGSSNGSIERARRSLSSFTPLPLGASDKALTLILVCCE